MKGYSSYRFLPVRLAPFLVLFSLVNCGKDINENYFEEENAVENAAIGQNEAYDVLEIDYQAEVSLKSSGANVVSPDVANCITYSNAPASRIVTLDFGALGACTGPFLLDRVRSGRILINYSTTLADSMASRTITFDNYMVSGKQLAGAIQFLPGDTTSAGKLQGVCTFANLKVTFPNGTWMTFNGSQTRTWVFGEGDGVATNNGYLITGDSLTGLTSSNRSFRADMKSTVSANFACAFGGNFARWYGVIELSRLAGYPDRTRTADYGDSICDKTIQIITYRRTYTLSVD